MKNLNNYIAFKINQYTRITNFDFNQKDSKSILKAETKSLLKGWIQEAIQSGV